MILDVVMIGVNLIVVVLVGDDIEFCFNVGFQLVGEIIGGIGMGIWIIIGDGMFDDDCDLDVIYMLGFVDIVVGSVMIIFIFDDFDGDGFCISEIDFLLLMINLVLEIISIDLIFVFCEGDNGLIIIIVEGGIVFYIIIWSNGDVGLIVINFELGFYIVIIVDDKGCIIEFIIELVKECFDLVLIKELIFIGLFFFGDVVIFEIVVIN